MAKGVKMAKNNQQGCCVFDALAKVVYYQFGISLTIDDEVRFEKHHKKSGFKGIHIEKMPEVINDLMKPHKIRVNAIYAEMINDTTDKAKLKADGMDEFFLKLVKFVAVELK